MLVINLYWTKPLCQNWMPNQIMILVLIIKTISVSQLQKKFYCISCQPSDSIYIPEAVAKLNSIEQRWTRSVSFWNHTFLATLDLAMLNMLIISLMSSLQGIKKIKTNVNILYMINGISTGVLVRWTNKCSKVQS